MKRLWGAGGDDESRPGAWGRRVEVMREESQAQRPGVAFGMQSELDATAQLAFLGSPHEERKCRRCDWFI